MFPRAWSRDRDETLVRLETETSRPRPHPCEELNPEVGKMLPEIYIRSGQRACIVLRCLQCNVIGRV